MIQNKTKIFWLVIMLCLLNLNASTQSIIDTIDSSIFIHYDQKDSGVSIKTYSKDSAFFQFDGILIKTEKIDLNEDGYIDIKLCFVDNRQFEKILINHSDSIFSLLESWKFVETTRMKDSKYYFSYKRLGCSGSEYSSQLFYYEGMELIVLGKMYTVLCDDECYTSVNYKNKSKQSEGVFLDKERIGFYWEDIIKTWK